MVEIWQALQGTYTSAAAYSLLSFNLLCAPCFAAIGAIHREMNSRKWTLIAVGYQCGFAYLVSFMIYQFAHLLEGGSIVFSTYLAGMVLIGLGYALLKKQQKKQEILTLSLEGGN